MSAMLEYSDIKSPIHKLTGATKLIALIILGFSINDYL